MLADAACPPYSPIEPCKPSSNACLPTIPKAALLAARLKSGASFAMPTRGACAICRLTSSEPTSPPAKILPTLLVGAFFRMPEPRTAPEGAIKSKPVIIAPYLSAAFSEIKSSAVLCA